MQEEGGECEAVGGELRWARGGLRGVGGSELEVWSWESGGHDRSLATAMFDETKRNETNVRLGYVFREGHGST